MAKSARKPLSGKTVVVTRARHQAGEFSRLLRRLGAKPFEFPVIEIRPLESPRLDRFLDRLCEGLIKYDYVIFTSRNGADDFFRRAGSKTGARVLRNTRVVAIGPRTARVLEHRGVRVRELPEKYVAESVAEMLGKGGLRGRKVLLLRAKGARETLPRRLRQAGATVTVRSLYEAVPARGDSRKLKKLLQESDYVTVMSGSTVRSLVKIASGKNRPGPGMLRKIFRNVKLASIGPVTSRVARRLGLRVEVEAKEYTIDGLAQAIARHVQTAD